MRKGFALIFAVLLLGAFLFTACNNSDVVSVSGKVIAYGEELSGVEITVNGDTLSTVSTDEDGCFNLQNLSAGDVIRFYKDGYLIDSITFESNADGLKIVVAERVVSVTAIEGEGGNVTGGGDYLMGDEVVLNAVCEEGYEFLGYFLEDELLSAQNEYRFTAETDIEISAQFLASEEETIAPQKLSTPQVVLSESTLSWPAVANADYYLVTANGREYVSECLTFSLNGLFNLSGSYNVKVAACSDSPDFTHSDLFEIEYTYLKKLDSPMNVGVTFSEEIWLNFSRVNNAADYAVYINGQRILASENEGNFKLTAASAHLKLDGFLSAPCTAKICVCALSENADSSSEKSAEIEVKIKGEIQPVQLRFSSGKISWDESADEVKYMLAVNGVKVELTSTLEYDVSELESGSYTADLYLIKEGYFTRKITIEFTI